MSKWVNGEEDRRPKTEVGTALKGEFFQPRESIIPPLRCNHVRRSLKHLPSKTPETYPKSTSLVVQC